MGGGVGEGWRVEAGDLVMIFGVDYNEFWLALDDARKCSIMTESMA